MTQKLEQFQLLLTEKSIKVHSVLPDAEIGEQLRPVPLFDLGNGVSRGTAGIPHTVSASGENITMDAVTIIPQNKLSEASAALAVLGYSQAEINVQKEYRSR